MEIIAYLLVAVSDDLGYVLLSYICIYIGFSCTSSSPPPPGTAVLVFLGLFQLWGGRSSFQLELRRQKIGFLTVLFPGGASPPLLLLVLARGVFVRVVLLLLSPVRSSSSHCDACATSDGGHL